MQYLWHKGKVHFFSVHDLKYYKKVERPICGIRRHEYNASAQREDVTCGNCLRLLKAWEAVRIEIDPPSRKKQ